MSLDYTIDIEPVKRLLSIYMPLVGQFVVIFAFVLWLSFLTLLVFKTKKSYDSLLGETNKQKLSEALEAILFHQKESKKHLADLITRCDKIEKDGALHIQKIGLLRFNPFKDTGGDQSFILALIDAQNTGVVISGLYSRSGTRWYAKQVVEGEGIDHELSEEERKALKLAKHH